MNRVLCILQFTYLFIEELCCPSSGSGKKIAFGIGTDSRVSSLTVSLVRWKRKGSFLELESLLRLSSLIGLLCVILVSSYGFILNWRLGYKNDLSWQSHLHLSTNHFYRTIDWIYFISSCTPCKFNIFNFFFKHTVNNHLLTYILSKNLNKQF